MTASIYDQKDASFSNVSAYVVMLGTQRIATVAFKFGGAVTAYVHIVGLEMTKGRAGGGGYDRQSAAVKAAIKATKPYALHEGEKPSTHADNLNGLRETFMGATISMDSQGWVRQLETQGFTVFQAV